MRVGEYESARRHLQESFEVAEIHSPIDLLAAKLNLGLVELLSGHPGLSVVCEPDELRNERAMSQSIAANVLTTLSPSTINEARVQYTHSRLGAPVNDLVGPAVTNPPDSPRYSLGAALG